MRTVILIALVVLVLFGVQAIIAPLTRATSGPGSVVTGLSIGYPVSLNNQQKLFFDSTSKLWWIFYSDGSAMQCTTSSDGVSWAPPYMINSSVPSGNKFSGWLNSSTGEFYYVATNGGPYFHYHYGELSASGCGSISWSTKEVAGSFGNVNTPTISASSPSAIWISVTENTKTNYYIEVFLCNASGCSSKHLVPLPNITYESIVLSMGSGQSSSLDAGLLYAADNVNGGSPIRFDYTTDGGNTWVNSSFETVNSYGGNRMSAYGLGKTVYVAGIEDNPNNVLFFNYTLGGTKSAETQVIAAGGSVRNVDITAYNGTGLVVGYTDSTNVGYAYTSDLGNSWKPVQILFSGEPTIYQSVLNIGRGPDNLIGLLWSQGTSSRDIEFGTFSLPGSTITTTSVIITSPTTRTGSSNITSISTNTTRTGSSNSSISITNTGSVQTTTTNPTVATSPTTSTTGQGASSKATSDQVYLLLSMDILSAFVAYPISYYSFRFNRFLDSNSLKVISVGFAILGTGLLVEGLTTFIADATVVDGLLAKKLVADGGLIFLALQLVAYVSFVWGYGMQVFGKERAGTSRLTDPGAVLPVSVITLTFGAYYDVALLAYLLMVALLAFVVFEAVLIYGKNKRRSALIVLLGFALILVGHVLMLDSIAARLPTTFYDGTVAQFVGFILLLWFVVRSGRIRAT